jgi:hypothetical protein
VRHSILFRVVGIIAIASCGENRPAPGNAPPDSSTTRTFKDSTGTIDLPSLPCFAMDSLTKDDLAFGTIDIDAETQDASGTQFAFRFANGRLRGTVRDASGEVPLEQALLDLVYDPKVDSISFWYGDASRFYYRFRPRCTELSGIARLFVTDADSTGEVVDERMARAPRIRQP